MFELLCDPAIPFPGICPREWKAYVFIWKQVHKNLYRNAHNNIINSPKEETTQMSANWSVDKQDVVYVYDAVLFSHDKESETGGYCYMDEPRKCYANWEKPDR